MFCPIAKEGSGLGSHFLGGFTGPSTAFSFFIIYLLLILFDRRMNWGEFYSVDQGRPQ